MRILNAPEGEKLLTLDPPGGLVGRSTDSALVLAYDSVSRQHAELRHDGKDWWLLHRSQTSATLLDDQLLAASVPKKLAPHGRLQLGRVVVEYRQEALPTTLPPAEPSPGEVTLVLPRRASVVFPQALLAQMSPVRVDPPEPAGPPPTLTRAAVVPPTSPATAEPSSPPTIIRQQRPPTPAAVDAPPTMIRQNRPPSAAPGEAEPPPTMIRRPQPPPLPPAPAASPATLIRPASGPDVASGALAAPRPKSAAAPVPTPIVEHQHDLGPAVATSAMAALTQLQTERDRLRRELDAALAEVATLRRNETVLQDAKAALCAQLTALQADKPPVAAAPPASPDATGLRDKALELLQPFSRNLEQAGEALRTGSPDQARALLRSASFALADLRDLFQS